jgi:hypothetical protein
MSKWLERLIALDMPSDLLTGATSERGSSASVGDAAESHPAAVAPAADSFSAPSTTPESADEAPVSAEAALAPEKSSAKQNVRTEECLSSPTPQGPGGGPPASCTRFCAGADWWERPPEAGGGWVCGRCHPDPRRGHPPPGLVPAGALVVLDPERARLLDWALEQGCPALQVYPWLTVVDTSFGWNTFIRTASTIDITAALTAIETGQPVVPSRVVAAPTSIAPDHQGPMPRCEVCGSERWRPYPPDSPTGFLCARCFPRDETGDSG